MRDARAKRSPGAHFSQMTTAGRRCSGGFQCLSGVCCPKGCSSVGGPTPKRDRHRTLRGCVAAGAAIRLQRPLSLSNMAGTGLSWTGCTLVQVRKPRYAETHSIRPVDHSARNSGKLVKEVIMALLSQSDFVSQSAVSLLLFGAPSGRRHPDEGWLARDRRRYSVPERRAQRNIFRTETIRPRGITPCRCCGPAWDLDPPSAADGSQPTPARLQSGHTMAN